MPIKPQLVRRASASVPVSVMGVDFSMTSTGICILGEHTIRDVLSIETKPCKGDFDWDDQARYKAIIDCVFINIQKFNVKHLFVEAPAYGAYDSEGRLYQLKGVFLYRLWHELKLPYPNYVHPTKLKKFITGAGNKSKNLMGESVRRYYSTELQNVQFKNDDEIDAFALAKFGQTLIRTLTNKQFGSKLPKYQQESLKGVTLNV